MRIFAVILACLAIFSCSRDVEAPRAEALRILFVGNSLTYAGNLPAVFDALSEANGRATASDMIVIGGGTLTERLADGSVAAALANGKYSYVVLQERGGDFMCAFGPESCDNALASLNNKLTRLVQDHGAVPLLLGTFQAHPEASKSIVATESFAAREAGLDYISVSERLQQLRVRHPGMTWFAPDGGHPGADLTLLEAVLLFERIHDAKPVSAAFTVSAQIYEGMSPLTPELRAATAVIEGLDVPSSVRYDSERILAVTEGAE